MAGQPTRSRNGSGGSNVRASMRILDHQRPIFGRTIRELVLIAMGTAFTAYAAALGDRLEYVAVYAFATIVFALRFYPARAFAVGTCIAALVQSAAGGWSLLGTAHVSRFEDWTLYIPVPFLALTVSKDLVERFDRAPSRFNLWGNLPHADALRLRVCLYAMASLAAVFVLRYDGNRLWTIGAMVSLWLSIALLALGRAFVLLVAPLIAAASATVWTLDHRSETALDLAVPITCALVIVAAAAPYAVRLVRRAA